MSSSAVDPVIQDMFTDVISIVHRFIEEWEPGFLEEPELEDPKFASKLEEAGDDDDAVKELYEHHDFMKDKDMGNVPGIAGLLEMSRQKHTERIATISEDPTGHFDHAVAYAVIQKAGELFQKQPSSDCLPGLVELVYKVLHSAGVPKPAGTVSLDSLIKAAESKLLSVREKLVGWLRECEGLEQGQRRRRLEESEKWDTLCTYVMVISFMSLLHSRLRESRSWRHTDDLKALGRLGFRVVCDCMQLDEDPMLPNEWRILLMRIVLVWFEIAKDDCVVELIKEADLGQRQACVWRDRLNDFFRHFPSAFEGDLDVKDQVDEIRLWADLVEFRHASGLVGIHAED